MLGTPTPEPLEELGGLESLSSLSSFPPVEHESGQSKSCLYVVVAESSREGKLVTNLSERRQQRLAPWLGGAREGGAPPHKGAVGGGAAQSELP